MIFKMMLVQDGGSQDDSPGEAPDETTDDSQRMVQRGGDSLCSSHLDAWRRLMCALRRTGRRLKTARQ